MDIRCRQDCGYGFGFVSGRYEASVFEDEDADVVDDVIVFDPEDVICRVSDVTERIVMDFFDVLIVDVNFLITDAVRSIGVFVRTCCNARFSLLRVLDIDDVSPDASYIYQVRDSVPLIIFALVRASAKVIAIACLEYIVVLIGRFR